MKLAKITFLLAFLCITNIIHSQSTPDLISRGIEISPFNNELVRVDHVYLNSQAYQAGIEPGDLLLSLDNEILAPDNITNIFATTTESAELLINRGGAPVRTILNFEAPDDNDIKIRDFEVIYLSDGILFTFEVIGEIEAETLNATISPQIDSLYIENAEAAQEYRDDNNLLNVQQVITFTEEENEAPPLFRLILPYDQLPDYANQTAFDIELKLTTNDTDIVQHNLNLQLNQIPDSQENLSATNTISVGDFSLTIHHIWFTDRIEDDLLTNENYLILETTLYNFSEEDKNLNRSHFFILGDDEEEQWVDVDEARKIRDTHYDEAYPYPGTEVFFDGHAPLTIRAGKQVDALLVYKIPVGTASLNMNFRLENQLQPFTLWMNPVLNSDTMRFLITDEGDLAESKTIEWNIFDAVIENVIDSETVSLENCLGTGTRTSSRALTRSITTEVTLETEATGGLTSPVPALPLETTIRRRFEKRDAETLEFELREDIEVPPGSVVNYEFVWYLVSIQGEMTINIGDERFVVPFSLGDRIRGEVRSLPPGECE